MHLTSMRDHPDEIIASGGQPRHLIVIGGSAGALPALRQIVGRLPANLPAAVCVVIHTAPDNPSILPRLLSKAGPLPAAHAVDRQAIREGRVLVAPPDHHLVVEAGYVRVTRGPRENRARPAVDPLFRTAAHTYGSRVVGVILSGGRDDGVLGLSRIKQAGGIAIVQDPGDAEVPNMPEAALRQVPVDHVLAAHDIAAVLSGLLGRRGTGYREGRRRRIGVRDARGSSLPVHLP